MMENLYKKIPKYVIVFNIIPDLGNLNNKGLQGGWGVWSTRNVKKLSSSQAQLGQATCLAVAYFLSIYCGPSTPSTLYILERLQ